MFGKRLVMFETRLIMFGRGLGRGVAAGGGYGGGGWGQETVITPPGLLLRKLLLYRCG